MRARLVALAMLSLGGCFAAHQGERPDGGIWTSCLEALYGAGAAGDPCDFEGSCSDAMPCGPLPVTELMCVRGELRFIERTCTLAPWDSCEHYVADFPHVGSPGQSCIEETFDTCLEPAAEPCCATRVTCASGVVHEELVCDPACAEGAYCPGYQLPAPGTQTCRWAHECASGTCLAPGPRLCGDECAPRPHECDRHEDCRPGEVCVHEAVPCACDDAHGTFCRPRCSPGSCPDGHACMPDGVCAPVHCSAGYACGPNMYCPRPDEDPPGPIDEHGCARTTCATDADCECGACISRVCWEGPGVCTMDPGAG